MQVDRSNFSVSFHLHMSSMNALLYSSYCIKRPRDSLNQKRIEESSQKPFWVSPGSRYSRISIFSNLRNFMFLSFVWTEMTSIYRIFVNSVFRFFISVFQSYQFVTTRKRYCLTSRSLYLRFRSVLKISIFSMFVIFHNCGGQSCVLFGFFVTPRARLV